MKSNSSVGDRALEEMIAAIGDDKVVVDPDVMLSLSSDRSVLAAAGFPLAVVKATDVEHVVSTLAIASRYRIPVVARGAGSGLVGGANAIDGCIILSVAGLNRILEVDPASLTATVECGVVTQDLDDAARRYGLWYPPDPASRSFSTIGGNIATNAGGGCCLKYGVTGDHVVSLRVVLASGESIQTGPNTRKNVAGLDLTRLIVGSEGTLGVIVEATVRLRPARPTPSTLVAFFPDLDTAVASIADMRSRFDLSLIELMDRETIHAVEGATRMGLDLEAGALVLAQSDTSTAAEDIEATVAIAQTWSSTLAIGTSDPFESDSLLQARAMALPALERLGGTLLDDVAVPTQNLAKMVRRIGEIAQLHGVRVGTFGHAGDGNLHPTIIVDRADPKAEERARRAFADILGAAVELGGSIAGEHGIGSLKAPYIDTMMGRQERDLMTGIKHVFDPENILNPGRGW